MPMPCGSDNVKWCELSNFHLHRTYFCVCWRSQTSYKKEKFPKRTRYKIRSLQYLPKMRAKSCWRKQAGMAVFWSHVALIVVLYCNAEHLHRWALRMSSEYFLKIVTPSSLNTIPSTLSTFVELYRSASNIDWHDVAWWLNQSRVFFNLNVMYRLYQIFVTWLNKWKMNLPWLYKFSIWGRIWCMHGTSNPW